MDTRSLPIFKIVLVGNSQVGKSSIVERYCTKAFNFEHSSTIGAAMFVQKMLVEKDGKIRSITVHIWETGGQERFFALVPLYLRNADAILFVFDASDRGHSLEKLKTTWLKIVEDQIFSPALFFTVGNKIDLLSEKDFETLQESVNSQIALGELPESLSTVCYTSAKDNVGIDALFNHIGKGFLSEAFLLEKWKYEELHKAEDSNESTIQLDDVTIRKWYTCCTHHRLS